MKHRKNLKNLICGMGAACLSAMASAPATAQQFEGPYACHALEFDTVGPSDTLGALTQGLSGYFFRTDPDLNWGFFLSNEVRLLLRNLNEELALRGTKLVLLPIPPRGLVAQNFVDMNQERSPILTVAEGGWMFDTYVNDLRSSGAVVPNLMEAFRTDPAQAPQFYFKRDTHWRPEGARFAAELVANELRQLGLLRGLMASGFQTSVIGENDLKGAIAIAAQQHCTQNLPPERYTEYVTRAMNTGAATGTDVVLVGGSFSADDRFNFAGFLSQSIGLPIENRAATSLREFNSIEAYLSSREFRLNPPQILIWEIQAALDLNHARSDIRQLITSAAGNCQLGAIAQAESVSGAVGDVIELTVSETQGVMPQEHFIHVSTSNPAMNTFVVSVTYADGDSEWIPIERSGRFENNGEYYISLSNEVNAPVTGVSLEQLSEASSSTRVELCRR